jgi:hypothetical protein
MRNDLQSCSWIHNEMTLHATVVHEAWHLGFTANRPQVLAERTLRSYVAHYNKGRPHSSLGPGIPEQTPSRALVLRRQRHRLPRDCQIRIDDILGGLHHEYWLEECVA